MTSPRIESVLSFCAEFDHQLMLSQVVVEGYVDDYRQGLMELAKSAEKYAKHYALSSPDATITIEPTDQTVNRYRGLVRHWVEEHGAIAPISEGNSAKILSKALSGRRHKRKGLDLRVRTVGWDKKKPIQMVERVDLLTPGYGNFADIAIEDPYETIQKQLGVGVSVESEQIGSGIFTSYLNQGVVFGNDSSKVTSIQIRRATDLMPKGLDFDQPAYRVAIYVPPVEAEGGVTASQVQEVRDAFHGLAGPRFVDARDEADFELHLKVNGIEHKVDQVIGIIPYKVNSTPTISYELFDIAAQKTAVDLNGHSIQATIAGKSAADYGGDVEQGAVMIVAAELASGLIKDPIKRGAAQLAIGALGGLSIEKMKDVMNRARERTKDLALHDAVGKIANAVEEAIGVPARVLAVDRHAGTVTLNVGANQGVQPGATFRLRKRRDVPW